MILSILVLNDKKLLNGLGDRVSIEQGYNRCRTGFYGPFEAWCEKTSVTSHLDIRIVMNRDTVIQDLEPLKDSYCPEKIIDREPQMEMLNSCLDAISNGSAQNLLLHGPLGTGKTSLLDKALSQLESVNVVRASCQRHNTQYKVLKQICSEVTGEPVKSGYHTSEFQRRIKEKTSQVQTLVVLDDIDFLLLNDGDDLLYYLSRLNPEKLSLVMVSSDSKPFSERIEERTYSSLYPTRIDFEPYSAEEIYCILAERARLSMKPESLDREALTYISSIEQHPGIALHWLRAAAERADNAVTEDDAKFTYDEGLRSYAYQRLANFTQHHRLLYHVLEELGDENPVFSSGEVYKQYQQLCEDRSVEPLCNRRVSDYLKEFEKLGLIHAEYHYGGSEGKTRKVRLSNH